MGTFVYRNTFMSWDSCDDKFKSHILQAMGRCVEDWDHAAPNVVRYPRPNGYLRIGEDPQGMSGEKKWVFMLLYDEYTQ